MRAREKHDKECTMGIAPIKKLIPLLKEARNYKTGYWSACCPAHDDKKPSLSVREFPDESISVVCFSGCSTEAILTAVKLNPRDLFPRNDVDSYEYRPPSKLFAHRLPFTPERIKSLRRDMLYVQIATAQLASGEELSEEDLDKLGIIAINIYEALNS